MSTLPQQYAVALRAAEQSEPKSHATLFRNLVAALKRRHHQKLLPRIELEYQKLLLHEKRLEEYRAITPARERTRILLELYQKLISRT